MTTSTVHMKQGAELPSLQLDWYDGTGAPLQLASGYTFTVKLASTPGGTSVITPKTTGITGSNTLPSVSIDWATTGELSTLAAGTYYVDVQARRVADSKDRFFPTQIILIIDPSIT
jgi:hypothetical protein